MTYEGPPASPPAGAGRPSRTPGRVHRGTDCCGSIHSDEPVLTPLALLRVIDSPRVVREDPDYAALLAGIQVTLPPILVHCRTMRVIDGIHRVRAAELRGDERIAVRYFHGDDDAAFVMAVRENLTHGKPLSRQDRLAAAGHLLRCHPEWSDRVIAATVGVSPDALGRLRTTVAVRQLNVRVGRDGRVRPIDPRPGRLRAWAALRARPDASLREVAREAGIAVGTARDVRSRLRRGEDPIPHGQHRPDGDRDRVRAGPATGNATHDDGSGEFGEALSILHGLTRDPSLRFTDDGRRLLRLLDRHALTPDDQTALMDILPPHCARPIANFARTYSGIWRRLAEKIEQKGAD